MKMEAEKPSDHSSNSSDEEAGSDSSSTYIHSGERDLLSSDVVMRCHRSPLDWGVEGERQLQRMATRGGIIKFFIGWEGI